MSTDRVHKRQIEGAHHCQGVTTTALELRERLFAMLVVHDNVNESFPFQRLSPAVVRVLCDPREQEVSDADASGAGENAGRGAGQSQKAELNSVCDKLLMARDPRLAEAAAVVLPASAVLGSLARMAVSCESLPAVLSYLDHVVSNCSSADAGTCK